MDLSALLHLVIFLVIVATIFWLVMWFVGYVGVQEPWLKIIKVILGLAALVIVVDLLLGFVGGPHLVRY